MTHEKPAKKAAEEAQRPHKIRLPGFLIDQETGLGDVVKKTTSYIGIHPCGGCDRRAAAMNRWLVFTRGERG